MAYFSHVLGGSTIESKVFLFLKLLKICKIIHLKPITRTSMGNFTDPNKDALRGGITKSMGFFFFKGASSIKKWEKSRMIRYGLPLDFFNNGQNP